MNKSFQIVALFILALTSSCINEDIDDCVYDKQLKINFSYFANSTENVLVDYINESHLYVYEKDTKKLVTTSVFDKASLASKDGVTINLVPGEYVFVAFGNKSNMTELKSSSDPTSTIYQSTLLAAPNYYSNKMITGNDALYIATKEYDIKDDHSSDRIDMKFHSAHVKFDVHVTGLDEEPNIIATNLVPEINCNIEATQKDDKTYAPGIINNSTRKSFQARFNTWRINRNNDVHLEITPDNGVTHRVNLNSFLTEFLPSISLEQEEIWIPIQVEYKDLSVKIKVPDWVSKPTIPGIG